MVARRPPLTLAFEPRFCANHVVDLTAGCTFGCLYCPFADVRARATGVPAPLAVDMQPLPGLPAPATVMLSPASDPFAPQAAARTHALLAHLLPRGTVVGLLTKGTIPRRTLDLLAAYAPQVEGVGIGLTSLDDARNRRLEPGCPPARARLETLARVVRRGLPCALRLDPIFPDLDDADDALAALVDAAAARGATGVTATYLFAFGRARRRLRHEPLAAASLACLIERAPMEGGVAFSVPLARKLATYARLAALCAARGMRFSTCGCKDLRVRDAGDFVTRCRNTEYLAAATRNAGCPAPARVTPVAPTAVPR
ncbi:MAG: radical SAM protein [bacterium]|nr:radical SAM protein [bacterium]